MHSFQNSIFIFYDYNKSPAGTQAFPAAAVFTDSRECYYITDRASASIMAFKIKGFYANQNRLVEGRVKRVVVLGIKLIQYDAQSFTKTLIVHNLPGS